VGGVLGGITNALIAPLVFNSLLEYPLAMVLGCVLVAGAGAQQTGSRTRPLMAALPLGVWLGRVPPAAAGDVVSLLRAGRFPLEHLRGVAGMTPAEQVADAAVRRETGLDGIDDVHRIDAATVGTADGRAFTVRVTRVPTGVRRPVSCGPGAKVEDPGRYDVELLPARPPLETGRPKR